MDLNQKKIALSPMSSSQACLLTEAEMDLRSITASRESAPKKWLRSFFSFEVSGGIHAERRDEVPDHAEDRHFSFHQFTVGFQNPSHTEGFSAASSTVSTDHST